MKKGITPIIAIIVLLLITVALAGAAWTYLSGYMSGLTEKSYEIRDAFCAGGSTGVILLANNGVRNISTDDITIIDLGSGNEASGGWTLADGTTPTDIIPMGGIARWDDDGGCGTSCSYRVTGGTARAQVANINC